ncbi:DNA-dependent metalloprotease SPRTN isoform X2 [Canis lupus baileyi]|uniref:DNA-dependent metalloprotease SPRTN isoform X2 n=1 Tax=Canis lupus familiaris TaxID=9615 RepID=UPI0003AE4179|nr:DNA-dependent metalloprotease SPRTN isoform X2 [Canis lupus familiaris]XP_025304222.1 DNA-dependent metalloprotease SPRTN isoform X2 [Canis lupus dingo]XP_038389841.1 DNA-dependent metalloprotease SPRTN isoform X2 [Canis lupus familiaris]XP_038518466.1 DNA-dependent metalloprotease SPRTN isoform X2 [Canis lupus familiaris]|eukprot:XP_005618875.1 sprT-like domain-containing protein Spartan isoform X2 [Canis lupus familiaris]
MDEDLVLALRLQEEWNLQGSERDRAQAPLSLVDASWELVDPTPDLQALFVQFNDRFFWGQLEAVEVKWSLRMTLCAGLCSYEGRGGMCSIRLSEPLLKLRPRKDLVEVYHTFHDEVDEYRRHWWRCNGPCQYKKPYYGYVKRATNRAPSVHDYWWAEHQKTCGGTYIKIKEPENYSKKGKGKTKVGKQPTAAENKDKSNRGETQLLIPFSGKGYVLGETSNSPSSGKFVTSYAINKTQDLLSQDHSAKALRPNSKIEVKFEQNGSSKKTPLVSPILTASHQNVLSNYFPRVSVANQKTFRSVNGSPTKSLTTGDITKNSISSGSHKRVTSSKISLRNSLKAPESTSVTAPQDVSGPEEKLPSKRPRLEDKTVFDNFFIKKEQVQSGGNDPKWSSHPTAATQDSSSASSQNRMVDCPVCQNEVLESQINEHLDWCLEGGSIKVKS